MSGCCEVVVAGEKLLLFPQKFLIWEAESLLLVSDCHFGKAAHFRKEGLAIPQTDDIADLHLLFEVARQFQLKTMLILGDLFHSDWNNTLAHLKAHFSRPGIPELWLCLGNHDKFSVEFYKNLGFQQVDAAFKLGPFLFTHEPIENSEKYNLSGHVHPGIKLAGKGRQQLNLPCFYFGKQTGLLPAYGSFTGRHTLRAQPEDQIFALTGDSVLRVSGSSIRRRH